MSIIGFLNLFPLIYLLGIVAIGILIGVGVSIRRQDTFLFLITLIVGSIMAFVIGSIVYVQVMSILSA